MAFLHAHAYAFLLKTCQNTAKLFSHYQLKYGLFYLNEIFIAQTFNYYIIKFINNIYKHFIIAIHH